MSDPAASAARAIWFWRRSDCATAARALSGAERMPLVVVGAGVAALAADAGVELVPPRPTPGGRSTPNHATAKSSETHEQDLHRAGELVTHPRVVGRIARFR